jgi:hypothetical protein
MFASIIKRYPLNIIKNISTIVFNNKVKIEWEQNNLI